MEDPVIFLEHKGLYRQVYSKTPEPGADYLMPFGKGRVGARGDRLDDRHLGQRRVSRCLRRPASSRRRASRWRSSTCARSSPSTRGRGGLASRKTGKALVVHEAILTVGFGAEMAARIADRCFAELDAPVKRLAAKDCFVAYAGVLENAILPSQEDVTAAVRELARW